MIADSNLGFRKFAGDYTLPSAASSVFLGLHRKSGKWQNNNFMYLFLKRNSELSDHLCMKTCKN